METYFFSGWDSLARTLLIGVLAYVALVVLLRISGNRSLSKMNAFDLIVTVALGSTRTMVTNVATLREWYIGRWGNVHFAIQAGLAN